MIPTKKNDLFILTGASCIGKSTVSELLFQQETDYIVLESDLLWDNRFNTPEDNYRAYRELWMTLCYNISQIGKPVLLCGCATPEQFESCNARMYFKQIYYIAIVSDADALEERMRKGRNVTDDNWIRSSKEFNQWLLSSYDKVEPKIRLFDSTDKAPSCIA